MKKILILGAGGFIGNHLVEHHVSLGDNVTGVDLVYPAFNQSSAHRYLIGDLTDRDWCLELLREPFDMVYMMAAVMGGAGFIFTGYNDADILGKSLMMNINVLDGCLNHRPILVFASSACVYPEHNQMSSDSIKIDEPSAYPAAPDSNYGWGKLISERLCQAYANNQGLDTRIVRIHNVYGPMSVYDNGKEKAPAAICRKVVAAKSSVDVWGNGHQLRSFLHIDDFLEGLSAFIGSSHPGPINIGSTETISINDLTRMIINISGKDLTIHNINGPVGVNARMSDNGLIQSLTGWEPKISLEQGMRNLYQWISQDMIKKGKIS